MFDLFNRQITYLRISVTDKCNLRCIYCMPEEGVERKAHKDLLRFEEIQKIAKTAATLGITKLRLTGGEPLVRKGIEELVRLLREIPEIKQIGMTTNGILLAEKIDLLKKAGLSSVNISLDTLNPDRYRSITRRGNIDEVFRGIEAARKQGLPVKINMVILKDTTDQEIDAMRAFCREKNVMLQFIAHYDLKKEKREPEFYDRPPDCRKCNRIRLLSDGKLKPCLHSNIEIPVDLQDIEGSLIRTIRAKPEKGIICTNRNMIEIGG